MAGRRKLPAVVEPDRPLWERRKGEAIRSYSNFAHYRDLGHLRSLAKAASDLGKSIDTLKEQSVKYDWVERAEAYDDDYERRIREERETERMRLERAQLGLGSALVGLSLTRVRGRPPGVGQDGTIIEEIKPLDPSEMDAGDVARMAIAGVRIQRLAAGLPTDTIRGATAIAAHDVVKLVKDVIDILSPFIPEERQPRAFAELDAYIASGRRW